MRQPPPRTAIRTIRQPPGFDAASSLSSEFFDDDATAVVHDSPHDDGCDEEKNDGVAPLARHAEPVPRRSRVRDKQGDATGVSDGARREKLSIPLKPEWPVLTEEPARQDEAREQRERSAEPRRRLASLALASGTGEDVAALGTKGPRPRMFLAVKPFRVLIVFLAVLLLVLWGWLALRIVPSPELASGDGPESSTLSNTENTVKDQKPHGSQKAEDNAGEDATSNAPTPQGGAANGQHGAQATGTESSAPSGTVVVYVSGAVQQPGVYTLPASSRVNDVVTAAGGMTENADPAGINLAAQLEDAQHVHIPEPGEAPVTGSSGGSSAAPAASSGNASGESGGLININTAGETELQELPGIGPALSSAIVQWRDEHGSFSSVDDLLDVPGVGPAKLSQLRERATV